MYVKRSSRPDSLRNVNVNRARYVCPIDREINRDGWGGARGNGRKIGKTSSTTM